MWSYDQGILNIFVDIVSVGVFTWFLNGIYICHICDLTDQSHKLTTITECMLYVFVGLGPEESQPFNMSLETEMLLERLKEQHFKEMETIQEKVGHTVPTHICKENV